MSPLIHVALLFFTIVSTQSPPVLELRLADGPSQMEGRLEVLYQGEWGTVCTGGSFDLPEASVVCRQLGYPYALEVKSFGPGVGNIVVDKLNCNGNEASIMDCYHDVIGRSRCGHAQDAGVICSEVPATEDPVTQLPLLVAVYNNGRFRLIGGPDPYQGQVEIFLFNTRSWLPMCGDGWTFSRASFVCKKLGYRPATSFGRGRYTPGTGQKANCSENAFDYGGRYNTDWDVCAAVNETDAVGDCAHNMAPDVVCSGTEPGKQWHIRLVEGSNTTQGRVELYDQNVWKGLCSEGWTMSEAQVVCRQLGLLPPLGITPGGTFGSSNDVEEILQISLDCTGQEYSLMTCLQSPRLVPCTAGDAAVQCGTSREVEEFDLRLVGDTDPGEGRVQMFFEGHWNTLCRSGLGDHEATVVCRNLGFQYLDMITFYGKGRGRMVAVLGVTCNGNEDRLVDCFHGGVRESSCVDSTRLGVICSNIYISRPVFNVVPQDFIDQQNNGKLRLVGGPYSYEGRVEVFVYALRAWASMCGGDWNFRRAVAVCQELNYRPATAFGTGGYGEGTGPIVTCPLSRYGWLDTRNCHVVDSAQPSLNCSHEADPYVVCSGTEPGREGELRLANGSEPTEGRVEIYHQNVWKTVCADDFGIRETQDVCYTLVYPFPLGMIPGGFFGNSEKYNILESVIRCTESELRFGHCPRTQRETPCMDGHAAVRCGNWTNAQDGDLRLVGGKSALEGRVQIYHNDLWGYVCEDSWNKEDANVVCHQLGYLTHYYTFSSALSDRRNRLAWVSDLSCSGAEENLGQCGVRLNDSVTCTRGYLRSADVTCDARPSAESFKARLADGPYPNQGRVELFYNNYWSTICDTAWDMNDAEVICRQLGFPSAVVALNGDTSSQLYGQGSGQVLIHKVDCRGSEENIKRCPITYVYQQFAFCGHSEDAGIVCFSEDYPSEDPTPSKDGPEDTGLSGSQIRNIILAVLIGCKLLLFLCWCCYKCCLKSTSETEMEVVTTTIPGPAETTPGSGYQPVSSDGDPPPPTYEVATKTSSQDGLEVSSKPDEANTAV